MFLTSLKQTCSEYPIKFSENQSAPKLKNRKTSPCSPCAPNLLHVLLSRIPGYHNLCSPVLHASFQDNSEHRFVLIVVPLSILLFPGDTDKETIFQVFWFLCNSLIVIALNFVVNLRLSGQFPKIEAIYDFLKLDEVHVVNNNVLFNAIVSTVILTGNVATSLYFLYIKDS